MDGRHILWSACLLCACTGCAGPMRAPQAELELEVPSHWSGRTEAPDAPPRALAQWWQRFHDPMLSDLMTQALARNTSIQSALATLRQARALRDVSAAALGPTLSGATSVQRTQRGTDTNAVTGTGTSNTFLAGLDAAWELDIFGANRSALDASHQQVLADAASLGDVQVSIAAEVALDYIRLRTTQARMAIAQRNLASQLDTLQITQWRWQAGLVTALDAEQSRTAAEQTSALLPALQTSLAQTSHALSVLVGQPPAALLKQLHATAPAPETHDTVELSVPAATLRHRADVRAAEHQLSAAQARIRQAQAARWPDFSISGSLGWSAATLGTLTQGGSVLNTILGSVTVPLFDGGALRAQVTAQEAAYDQARQTYRQAILTALTDVEDALVALQGDELKLVHLSGAAEAASNADHMAQQQYSSGLVDFQIVLETQRTALATQNSVASTRGDVASDQVRLYKALGGGWVADDGQTAQAPKPTPPLPPQPEGTP